MHSGTYLLVLALVGVAWGAGTKIDQSEDGNSGTISFSTPDLSDDEAHSPWMPDLLKCDACRGIAHQVGNKESTGLYPVHGLAWLREN